MAAVLAETTSDVLIVTEGSAALLPSGGYGIDAGSEWGYGPNEHRRKVLMWSRHPWSEVTALEVGAGHGRVVSALTNSPLGEILVIGVCIPWSAAHVSTGRRDARRWEEQIGCCAQLQEFSVHRRSIMAGDFNQTIPRIRQPIRAADALGAVLTNWSVGTSGPRSFGPLIDHLATRGDLVISEVGCWAASDSEGTLSDHVGVSCTVSVANSSASAP